MMSDNNNQMNITATSAAGGQPGSTVTSTTMTLPKSDDPQLGGGLGLLLGRADGGSRSSSISNIMDRDTLSSSRGSVDLNDKIHNLHLLKEREHRIVLNVGGRRFETYKSTFANHPTTLLGVMFSERNSHLLCPDANGEFFFDRSPALFEAVLDFYRSSTGEIEPPQPYTWKQLQKEIDYFQLPVAPRDTAEPALGERLFRLSLARARQDVGATLDKIKLHIIDTLYKAAEQGKQAEIIQFKSTSSGTEEFYSFVSNLRNRELLLHDLMNDNLDVSFSEEFGSFYHSYLFQITFWTRYTRSKSGDIPPADQILNEFRQKINQLSDILYNKK
ncbi:hypothetical protein SAMD00019534_108870, partial [Acytostelium subglobosum LB1]|uniref:hypothetical protein n=1 Tax=Acytostelium subglobosum LB1 TaxID=1410327 RepID=UPI00064516EF